MRRWNEEGFLKLGEYVLEKEECQPESSRQHKERQLGMEMN